MVTEHRIRKHLTATHSNDHHPKPPCANTSASFSRLMMYHFLIRRYQRGKHTDTNTR